MDIVTIDLDYHVRTDNCTGGTACAVSIVCSLDYARDRLGREVTVFIGFFGNDDAIFRAHHHT